MTTLWAGFPSDSILALVTTASLELEQPDKLHSALLRRHLFSALTKVRNIQTFICHNFVFIMQNKASAGGEVSLTNYSCLVILSYPSRVLFY